MKKFEHLGKSLNKEEQKKIKGGDYGGYGGDEESLAGPDGTCSVSVNCGDGLGGGTISCSGKKCSRSTLYLRVTCDGVTTKCY